MRSGVRFALTVIFSSVCGALALTLCIALLYYTPHHPSLIHAVYPASAYSPLNSMLSSIAALCIYIFGGIGAYCGALCLLLSALSVMRFHAHARRALAGGFLFLVIVPLWSLRTGIDLPLSHNPGGFWGIIFNSFATKYGDALVINSAIYAVLAFGLFLFFGSKIFVQMVRFVQRGLRITHPITRHVTHAVRMAHSHIDRRVVARTAHTDEVERLVTELFSEKSQPNVQPLGVAASIQISSAQSGTYQLPSRALFARSTHNEKKDDHKLGARTLEEKLERFGIKGTVVSTFSGPTTTLYEYEPSPNTKLSKILALEDDLALALEALSVRTLAPIPGKSVVGFEVARGIRNSVFLGDIIATIAFEKHSAGLPLAIGRDTLGASCASDLRAMPHLLIAGSTGSGKSVALHTCIASLLVTKDPDELKLILVDPKRLEFFVYQDVPHLLFPIITEPVRAVAALAWAVDEMQRRYQTLSQEGCRTIDEYHARESVAAMPFVVVVIDELADLMLLARADVEGYLVRLTQMARAAGIHVIVATQRPSVDIITGLVKVNIPARMAFKVTSKVDSRTILDSSGAEKLLGKGDMLFQDHSGTLVRVQGAYVTPEELSTLIATCKQRAPLYEDLLVHEQKREAAHEHDPLFDAVVTFARTRTEISISLIQRQFRIGYNRSARIMNMLESAGVVAPAGTGKMRKVV